tara:strand:+ start:49 stop:705 length:657 start_codon:yes stop_codon:yes gene_type:complete
MSKEYFEALKKTDKYSEDNQIFLKKRVFKTINSLISTFFNETFKNDQFLLDLGSSDNTLVNVALKHGMKAKGLDIVDLDLEKDKINLPDNSCDIVTAISLIEHIHQPKNFLSEVKRVLKKNKYFVMVTPDWSSNMKNFFDDPTHLHPYTRKSLKFLLESNGFKNIKVLPWLVCKPAWMWKVPFSFFLAKIIPFRGDASNFIPQFLKGKSKTILAICTK